LHEGECSGMKSRINGSELNIEVIFIRTEYLLNITLRKTSLEHDQRLSTMFSWAYQKVLSSHHTKEHKLW
jgi:hypothetical protein